MANKINQPNDNIDEIEEQQPSKIQGFLFVIIIPLIFAILVIAIVLSLTGSNVFEKVKDISNTVSTQVFHNSGKQQDKTTTAQFEKEIVDLEAEIKDKEAEIKSLQNIVDTRDQTIQQAEAEKQQLQKQLNDLQKAKSSNQNTSSGVGQANQGTMNSSSEVAKTYEAMSPKKSAPILAQMSDADSVGILANLKPETVAKVLEQMNPADAARLTKLLKVQP